MDKAKLQIFGVYIFMTAIRQEVSTTSCWFLPYLMHGHRTDARGNAYPATATFECDSGYVLSGSPNITCQSHGTWEKLTARCSGINCTNLPTLQHGRRTDTRGNTYPVTATFGCDSGYTLSWGFGDQRLDCRRDGTWEPLRAECRRVRCMRLPSLRNGKRSDARGDSYLDIATFSCDSGFILSGNPNITCQSDGTWERLTASCSGINCTNLPTLQHGRRMDTRGNTYPVTATFGCDTGYTLSWGQRLECRTDGTWEPLRAECRGVTCAYLPTLVHGRRTDTGGNSYLETATFDCSPGYTMYGNPTIRCQADGQWGHLVAICVENSKATSSSDGNTSVPAWTLVVAMLAVVLVVILILVILRKRLSWNKCSRQGNTGAARNANHAPTEESCYTDLQFSSSNTRQFDCIEAPIYVNTMI